MATSPTTPTGGVAGNSGAYQPKFRLTPEKYSSLNDLLEAKGSSEADAINKPEVRDLLIKTYGDQGITGFLKLTGAINNAGTADQIEFFEEGRRHRTLTLTTTDAGTTHTADFAIADDNDSDPATSKFVQTRDVIMNASSGVRYIVIDDLRNDPANNAAANNALVKLARLDGAPMSDSDDLSGATKFVVLGNLYGQGTAQPEHFMQPELKRYKNPFMIIKDRYQVNGSQATNVGYVNIGNGDYRWFMYGEQEARKRFEDRREMMMLYGELHDGTSAANTDANVAGSEGYFAAIKDRGLVATGADAAPLTLSNFDDIIIELDRQGAPAEYAMYLNRKQDLAIDDMLAAGIATQVTAGLAGQFGAFNNDADLAVKLGFKSFTRGGYTFHKHDWKLLNDPTLAGASTKIQGAMCPMTQVTDPRSGTKAPALEMNYKASNGYSRELEHWVTGGGVMGHNNNGDTGKDVMTFHYRSEINLITRAANQHVLIEG
jgi:hypothetical protein